MKSSARRRWTKGEKWLFGAPLLVGVFAALMSFGPELVRRRMGLPRELKTETNNLLQSLALSGDGQFLAACGETDTPKGFTLTSGCIFLWDAHTLAPLPPIKTKPFRGGTGWNDFLSRALAFSPDGHLLGVHRLALPYFVYDVASRRIVWQTTSYVNFAAFSRDGKFLALGGGSRVEIRRTSDGTLVIKWDVKSTGAASRYAGSVNFQAVAWSPDGEILACVGPPFQTKRKVNARGGEFVQLRRVDTGAIVRTLPTEGTNSIAFSPDGKSLVAVGTLMSQHAENGTDGALIQCFDIITGNLKWQRNGRDQAKLSDDFDDGEACDARFSPDGKTIATVQGRSKVVILLDAQSGAEIRRLHFRGETNNIYVPSAICWAPDGKRLLARGSDIVLVWDLD